MKPPIAASSLLLLCLAPLNAAAQQFQEQAGVLPLPTNYWTEGTTVVDADEDGRWDCLFVHANGWAVPGDFAATGTFGLPLILLVNTGTSGGNPVFVDQSATYLPSLGIHGKGASAADFDNDGHDDLVVAVAFGARPRLLMKDPSTLAWIDQSVARLPAMSLNCFHAGVGDLDDDGDLDIVFCDAGPSSFGAPGEQARLCINAGDGFFTEQPSWINAANKIGAQNAKIIDIDNDFDLDVVEDGKSPKTQLYFNDGTAHFSLNDSLIPAGSNSTYEIEWGDFDNDNDLDGAFMSLTGFTDGTVQNFLTDTGTLSFAATSTTLTGLNGEDDNEFVFIDSDNDGDLDVVDVSLSSQQEKLYINSGTFGPGFLKFTAGTGFSTIKDSSLDMCMADFDQDGDYDAVTGQGESGNFTDRYYRNSGPADTQQPRIGRVQGAPVTVPLATFASGGLVRHAWIQDSLWDDGLTFEQAQFLIDTNKLGETGSGSADMRHSGGQIFRGVIAPTPASTGLVGMHVSYRVEASDPFANTSVSSAQAFIICGSETYGSASTVNSIVLTGNTPVLGGTFTADAVGGPAGQPGLLLVGTARASLPLYGGLLLVAPAGALSFPISFDGAGTASFSVDVPSDPAVAGFVLDMQCGALDASKPQGVALSTGLEVALCMP